MDNPLKIFSVIWRSRRPRRVSDMAVLRNSFWLRKGYAGLTFFGTVIVPDDEERKRYEQKGSVMKNHEKIHLLQARSTRNSWLLFYLLYGWYYVRALPQNRRMKNAAYRLNPFELEAYRHERDLDYTLQDEATEWRRYAHMSPKERREQFGTLNSVN